MKGTANSIYLSGGSYPQNPNIGTSLCSESIHQLVFIAPNAKTVTTRAPFVSVNPVSVFSNYRPVVPIPQLK